MRRSGLALSASARKVRSVKLTLDGHALRTTAARGRWTAAVLPTAFADGDAHTLLITVKPRKGRARTMTETIKTAACATRYTAGQWRTKVGTGLRLRVDSRTALTSVTFPLPAALAKRGALKPAKGLGRLRIVQSGGVRTILQLGAAGSAEGRAARGSGARISVGARQRPPDHRARPAGGDRDRRDHAVPPRRAAAAQQAAPDGGHDRRGRAGQAPDQAPAGHRTLKGVLPVRVVGGRRAPVLTRRGVPM